MADGPRTVVLIIVNVLRWRKLTDRRPVVLRWSMAKQTTTMTFLVEHTEYGWSVGAGDERLGLFVTQQQALNDVKKRQARLTAKGQRSTVLVTGHGLGPTSGRSTRFYPYR